MVANRVDLERVYLRRARVRREADGGTTVSGTTVSTTAKARAETMARADAYCRPQRRGAARHDGRAEPATPELGREAVTERPDHSKPRSSSADLSRLEERGKIQSRRRASAPSRDRR